MRLKYILNLAFFSFLTRFLLLCKTKKLFKRVNAIGGFPNFDIKGEISFNNSKKVTFINNFLWSTLGIPRRCKLSVGKQAKLMFNGSAGLSNVVIVATKKIVIGNNVMIGGGVTIIDNDFHSMDYHDWFTDKDAIKANSSPVYIGDNVFIGMNSIILKGVHIGNGAVIGAGSVVANDIPENEIWAGNPAKFIKKR